MSLDLVMLTSESRSAVVLPALELLPHNVELRPYDATVLLDAHNYDVVLIDARVDLAAAKSWCRLLKSAEASRTSIIPVVREGGLVALSAQWLVDDFVTPTAGPAEVDVRLRLAATHHRTTADNGKLRVGELEIDESTYTARLRKRTLELTYKEFELLKYLVQHNGRVFNRTQLLQEVWGYDFFGGTRTVDVHIRRLRAKLGPEYEKMIGTVRNVGYKFERPNKPNNHHDTPVLSAW